jgi:hypothetical protein
MVGPASDGPQGALRASQPNPRLVKCQPECLSDDHSLSMVL